MHPEMERIQNCLAAVRRHTDFVPEVAVVLGSGLGGFADMVKQTAVVPYSEIPGFPVSTAPGHAGRFVFGYVEETPVVVMQGRVHLYEGYTPHDVVLPVRLMKAMGAKMPEEEMQPLVDAWRAANPNIVAFWSALDRAARAIIRRKTSARIGKVALYWQDDKMFMRLPSGRNLCYQSPHFTENRFGSDAIGYYVPNAAGQMVVQETFGGKLAENATQAIARDILAHALLTLEKNGYPVIFHVHDEAVIEMPIGQGSLEEACRLMAIAPDWAEDLPLRADGYECAYYQKS